MSFIGPALPAHLMPPRQEEEEEEEDEVVAKEEEKSPDREEQEGKSSPDREEEDDDDEEEPDLYGPALPPGFQAVAAQPRIIGPTLPPGINIGQAGEESSEEEEEDDVVGPMPVLADADQAKYLEEHFESRAARMKSKLTDKGKEGRPERETWMIDLPTNRHGLVGLEARSFRKSAGPDKNADNSAWTDTPADKLRKAQGGQAEDQAGSSSAVELENIAVQERDRAMAKRAAKHASKRAAESLVDMHQKEINKKKKEDAEKGQERKMFDREKDLQVNRFDESQKRAVLNKAKFLDDRFSAGNQKFL